MADSQIRIITEKLAFPEGPVALADGSVVIVELARGTLSRVGTAGDIDTVAQLGGSPNGAAIGPDGKIYVCNNGGVDWVRSGEYFHSSGKLPADYSGGRIEQVDLETGASRVLYDRCGEFPLRGPNDIVFDSNGDFWFTDLGKPGARSIDKGGVYWAKSDGSEIREVIWDLITPNGIAISEDGCTLYVSETQTSRLWSWEISGPGEVRAASRQMSHGGTFVWGASVFQRFDSLKVTASGKVCVATLYNGGITEIDPKTGGAVHHPLPSRHVTNLCFGGPDMRTAFVTLSDRNMLAALDWHEPGLKLPFQQEYQL